MLKTPFGNIKMFFNEKEVEYGFFKIENYKSFLETETYLIKYQFERKMCDKNKNIFLKCVLETDFEHKSYAESGERLEAISFEINNGKLTIGTTSGLYMAEIDGNNNDSDVEYLENGMKIVILEKTKNQVFYFGISFLKNSNLENEIQTWFGVDYAITRK